MEDELQWRIHNNGTLQRDAQKGTGCQFAVSEDSDMEKGFFCASHIEGMHELRQGQYGETHGASDVSAAGFVPQQIGEEGKGADEHAFHEDTEHSTAAKKSFFIGARRFFHNVFFRRFQSETDCREGVGHQIDKEKLNRQQRRIVPQQDGGEDGHNLADVAGQQEMNGFFDVLIQSWDNR